MIKTLSRLFHHRATECSLSPWRIITPSAEEFCPESSSRFEGNNKINDRIIKCHRKEMNVFDSHRMYYPLALDRVILKSRRKDFISQSPSESALLAQHNIMSQALIGMVRLLPSGIAPIYQQKCARRLYLLPMPNL
jgi:hypothetical protein